MTLHFCFHHTVIAFICCVCPCPRQVRLPLLPVDFLTGTVAKEEMIRGSLSCRDLMDEARNYHLHLSNKLDFEYSARTIPRKHTAGWAFSPIPQFSLNLTAELMCNFLFSKQLPQAYCSVWAVGGAPATHSAASSATPSPRTAGSLAPR